MSLARASGIRRPSRALQVLIVALLFVGAFAAGHVLTALAPALLRGSKDLRPSSNAVAPFTIEVESPDGDVTRLTVKDSEDACQPLRMSRRLFAICSIADLAEPAIIASQAFGELNNKWTPAFEALVWRARVDSDVSVCERGGLEDAFRTRCEAAAQDPAYTFADGGLEVRVPIGGA